MGADGLATIRTFIQFDGTYATHRTYGAPPHKSHKSHRSHWVASPCAAYRLRIPIHRNAHYYPGLRIKPCPTGRILFPNIPGNKLPGYLHLVPSSLVVLNYGAQAGTRISEIAENQLP